MRPEASPLLKRLRFPICKMRSCTKLALPSRDQISLWKTTRTGRDGQRWGLSGPQPSRCASPSCSPNTGSPKKMWLMVQPAQEQNVTDLKGPWEKTCGRKKTAEARGKKIPQEQIPTMKCTVKDTHEGRLGGSAG